LLALTEQHRELWNEVYSRPDLGRIYAEEADLVAAPVTVAEERFLNEVIVHFQTGWQLARQGSLITMDAMTADARTFFKLPIPRFVWQHTKASRDPKFVKFVEDSLAGDSRGLQQTGRLARVRALFQGNGARRPSWR
jgi:hypothetical protein